MKKRAKTREKARRRLIIFLVLAGILVTVSLIAPLLCPNDPNATSAADMNRPPCAEYPFGTDRYGRCVCSRVLMGGSVVIETIFRWPGLGKLAMDAINNRDYPVIQGFVLFTSTVYVVINLLIDIAYSWIDPRLRETGGGS